VLERLLGGKKKAGKNQLWATKLNLNGKDVVLVGWSVVQAQNFLRQSLRSLERFAANSL
jgi:hypothetical protein